MEANLLDRMLNAYMDEKTPVTVTLQNRVRVTGKIRTFDSYVIVMDNQKHDIVYRHAISSVAAAVPQAQVHKQPAQIRTSAEATAARPPFQKSAVRKPRPASAPRQQPLAAASDAGLNTSMKDGLVKWMQEQKAAK